MALTVREQEEVTLDSIAYEIGQYCIKWGRIPVTQTKEKYNTARVYCGFGISGLHGLLYPNYVYKHQNFPNWLWKLDIDYITPLFSFFNFIIIPYQKFIYKKAYWKQIKAYPHLFDEITSCADYGEILGFYFAKLCSKHSEDYSKTNYLVSEDECENCKVEKERSENGTSC